MLTPFLQSLHVSHVAGDRDTKYYFCTTSGLKVNRATKNIRLQKRDELLKRQCLCICLYKKKHIPIKYLNPIIRVDFFFFFLRLH